MNYNELKCEVLNIKNAQVLNLGSSVLGRTLFGIYFNFNKKENIIIHGAIHAREFVTTDLIIYLAKFLDCNYCDLKNKLPNILFVPMVNPDGVQLCNFGEKSVKNTQFCEFLLKINNGSDFKLFKANANGVDLNNNFNADFLLDPRYSKRPSSHGYPSKIFESEPESFMLASLARKLKPIFTISYHAKGEEIYYNFKLNEKRLKMHKKNARFFAKILKYKLISNCGLSSGGFKDYCIDKLKIPSITIEVAKNKYNFPLPKKAKKDIIKKHKNFYRALEKSYKFILKNKNKF